MLVVTLCPSGTRVEVNDCLRSMAYARLRGKNGALHLRRLFRYPGADKHEKGQFCMNDGGEEYAHDRVPLQWASTQGNLANVHIAWFEKTADPAHLDTAEGHARAAVEVFAEAQASHYIGVAERQLAEIARLRSGN